MIVTLTALAACTPASEVTISDARIRTPAPGQDKTAAYLDIHNAGAAPLTLTAVETPIARAVEFHRIERDGDMVRMRRQAAVVVAAGETVRFAPGGLHLMVFGVSSPVDGAEFTFTAEDGRRFSASFTGIGLGAQE
jgi:copper(I)-binding protein